jgi:hypothetical protein
VNELEECLWCGEIAICNVDVQCDECSLDAIETDPVKEGKLADYLEK